MSVGKPCGYGQYTWKNGSCFVGEFHDGMKNGFGKWRKEKTNKSNMYEGQYFRDKKQGFGIFKWASGNIYRGQYKGDEREGIGEMRWTDGSMYIGLWSRGIQHGYGRMIFPDGTIKEGDFDNNVYKGPSDENAPKEFENEDFDVMELAPKDAIFSEEIKNLSQVRLNQPATSYAQARYVHPQRYMTASQQPASYEHVPRNALYSVPIKRPNGVKRNARTISKESPLRSKQGRSTYVTNTSSQAKYFTTSSRSLLQQTRQVRSKCNPRQQNMTTMYNAYGQQLNKKADNKKVWKPSGRVHYNEPYKRPINYS